MRLEGKIAVVVGAGQTPGETIGNGRAVSLLFAREGARLLLVDRDLASAEATRAMIEAEGGSAVCIEADVRREEDCRRFAARALEAFGRIDILHNNVGVGAGNDDILRIDEETWDRILAVNLKGTLFSCRAVLPAMRERRSGVILNISSIAAVCTTGIIAYKSSKAALNAFTRQLAIENAAYGIRANAIMPGLMNTPMAIEGISKSRGIDKAELIRAREKRVPLGGKMGTAWDTAYAALFLASDEAKFITGVVLPVDGGQSARMG